ncbi:MAG: complex I NDUFA9 subunit family protein [Thiotrichales bacterium]
MTSHSVCILGGTGFVGSHLASRLVNRGHHVKVLTRHRHRHRALLVLPLLELIECDVHNPAELTQHFQGCDTVINLVGILNEFGGTRRFATAHVDLAKTVVEACRDAGVARLLHMSALNAAPDAPSRYLRSKGEAENQVHAAGAPFMSVTSFRPSVIFGPGDGFLNLFAGLLRRIPVALPLACPGARFAPVYVGDVADALIAALDDPTHAGKRIELCGPESYTLRELVAYAARMINRKRWIIGLPDWASKLQARVMAFAPGKPFTLDNYQSMQVDSVCRGGGHCPTPMDAVVPHYLGDAARDLRMQRDRETVRS